VAPPSSGLFLQTLTEARSHSASSITSSEFERLNIRRISTTQASARSITTSSPLNPTTRGQRLPLDLQSYPSLPRRALALQNTLPNTWGRNRPLPRNKSGGSPVVANTVGLLTLYTPLLSFLYATCSPISFCHSSCSVIEVKMQEWPPNKQCHCYCTQHSSSLSHSQAHTKDFTFNEQTNSKPQRTITALTSFNGFNYQLCQ
jgi:hypothetical protein